MPSMLLMQVIWSKQSVLVRGCALLIASSRVVSRANDCARDKEAWIVDRGIDLRRTGGGRTCSGPRQWSRRRR